MVITWEVDETRLQRVIVARPSHTYRVAIEDLGDWSETITYLSTLDAKEWIMSYFIASKIMKRQPYQIEKE